MAPDILFQGNLSSDNIEVHVNPVSSREVCPMLEERVEAHWRRCMEEAREMGQALWDSEQYRLNRLWVEGGRVYLELATQRYKTGRLLGRIPEVIDLGDAYYPDAIGAISLVQTSDGKYVLGIGGSRFYGHEHHDKLLGGSLVKDERPVQSAHDIFALLYAELEEEANIREEDVADMSLVGICRTTSLQIALVFFTRLNICSDLLLEQFAQQNDGEMAQIKCLGAYELMDRMRVSPDFDDVFYALVSQWVTY